MEEQRSQTMDSVATRKSQLEATTILEFGETRGGRGDPTETEQQRPRWSNIPSQKYTALTQTLTSLRPPKGGFQV